jgi:hypothetical protein
MFFEGRLWKSGQIDKMRKQWPRDEQSRGKQGRNSSSHDPKAKNQMTEKVQAFLTNPF